MGCGKEPLDNLLHRVVLLSSFVLSLSTPDLFVFFLSFRRGVNTTSL